jgi:thiamine-monophosphate kinase
MATTRRQPRPITELEALEVLSALPQPKAGRGKKQNLGIGDDAAILTGLTPRVCWTTDSCEEGVHFELAWMSPEDIAHKALHAAVSDIAAMGAKPSAMLCHVTLSPRADRAFFRRLVQGQAEVSRALDCPIVGGNLSAGERFGVVTTVLGSEPRTRSLGSLGFLTRNGAKAGDELWLLGSVGWSGLGLHLLRAGRTTGRGSASQALRAFRRPEALVGLGLELRGRATACLDVSDGLSRDARTLARSSGVRLVLEERACLDLLSASFIRLALELGLDPLEAALQGGEDYALLATGPSARRPRGAARIGRVERGEGAFLDALSGKAERLRGGFLHGSDPS